MFLSQACPTGCAECKESSGETETVCVDTKCFSTHVEVAASQCVGEYPCVTLDLDCVAPV